MPKYSIVLRQEGVEVPLIEASFERPSNAFLKTLNKIVYNKNRKPTRAVEVVGLVPGRVESYLESSGVPPVGGTFAKPVSVGQVFKSSEELSRHLGMNSNDVANVLSMARGCAYMRYVPLDCEARVLGVRCRAARGVIVAYKDEMDEARARRKAAL